MAMHESRIGGVSEDWSVILQSVSPKQKKEVVKRMVEIFDLEKKDAEQALLNMPLILLDNLSFGMAARIKNFFQKLGVVVETTNHDMIKKNCFQIVWPEVPDLAIFLKDDSENMLSKEQSVASDSVPVVSEPDLLKISETVPVPAPEMEVNPALPEVKSPDAESAAKEDVPVVESDWDKRARELSDRLQRMQDEKAAMNKQPSEEKEKFKSELQDRFRGPSEKQGSEEVSKLRDELAREIQNKQTLQDTCDVLRSQMERLENRMRDFQKADSKEACSQTGRQDEEAESRIKMLERDLAEREEEIAALQARVQELAMKAKASDADFTDKQRSLETAQSDLINREKEMTVRADALASVLQETEKSLEAVQKELAEYQFREKGMAAKTSDLESKIAEKENALQEATGQLSVWQDREKELIAKTSDLEMRLAKKEKTQEEAQAQVLHFQNREKELNATISDLETRLSEKEKVQEDVRIQIAGLQSREMDLTAKIKMLDRSLIEKEEILKARDMALSELERKVTELITKVQETENIRQEHAILSKERETIRGEYDAKLTEQEIRVAKLEDEHRRYRSRVDRRNAAAIRELGEWSRNVDILRQGLQKLIVFLGNQSAEPEPEKKNGPRALFNRSVNQNESTTT
ncbi:MAG TPA: hypothetical protein PLO78_07610 [Candidatus Omnitrophota bacterium]|nr:hypothetical protein [Candidatus Omnitrophota bacterium]